jgi:hypothetical protein
MNMRILAVVAAGFLLTGAGRFAGEGERFSAHTIYRQRRVAVPKPAMPRAEHVVHDQPRAVAPHVDERGARISAPAAAAPPAHHAEVVRSAQFTRGVTRVERTEVVPNRYFWHNDGGIRYSHFYDGRNHWYGFYHGPTFYWTRFHHNRWWWFDAHFGRWVFWWDGFWWWPGPGGLAYVYVDNAYYPYEGAGVTVQNPETMPAPASVPAPGQGAEAVSPDGRRMVEISGADGQAFLYDKTVTPPSYLMYLGKGASKVRYSGGTGGAPLQILVEFKDDTFALFDADGKSQKAAVTAAAPEGEAPPAPDSIPPPPDSAPGQ